MYDLLIIGAGPIGIFASFYAGMHKMKAITLETHTSAGGQLTRLYKEKYIYDIPGFKKIKAQEYIDILLDQYRDYENEVKIEYQTVLNQIDKVEDHFVVKTSKGNYETKLLLITSGNGTYIPRELEVEGANDCSNVLYFLDDLSMFDDKNVVVLGGGDSAVDWALELQKRAKSCTLIHRRNEFRAHQSSVDQLYSSPMQVLTPYNVVGIVQEGNEAKQIIIQNLDNQQERTLDVDYIIVNYGMKISNSIATNLGLENQNGAILVKASMESSLPGVYAAGNCVYYDGKIKTITCGLGEVSVAINAINHALHPSKAPGVVYSSILFHKSEQNEK